MGIIGPAITGTTTVRTGAAGLGIGRIAHTDTTVLTAIMGIIVRIGAPTAGIGATGAAGNREPT